MRVLNIVTGTMLSLFMQHASAQGAPPPGLPPGAVPCGGGWCVGGAVVAAGVASSQQSAPLDAARSGAANADDQRNKPGTSRGAGFGASMGIRIQGDGIGLPQGVGGGNSPASPREKEDEKDPEKKRASASAGCVGPNRDGQGCMDKDADPVARRIDQGLERSPGIARPTDTRVQGAGVATPRCFGDSRDGVECGK